MINKALLLVLASLVIISCSNLRHSEKEKKGRKNYKAEHIYRQSKSFFFPITNPKHQQRISYPWEYGIIKNLPKITKNFFSCKGNYSNLPTIEEAENGDTKTYCDCEGSNKHSLSLVYGKEGVYPVLIELLNYIQEKTKKRVIITCGHRCPIHNTYADSSKLNRTSKHMIGAEVDFYIQSMEEKPKEVVQLIFQFYKERIGYKNDSKYEEFLRYQKKDTNVSTPPWYNKEIFVKLYKNNEGRDFDNRHPYPYISIQVRFDRDLKEPVYYSWEKATNGYKRW
jgi:hypothetical protein